MATGDPYWQNPLVRRSGDYFWIGSAFPQQSWTTAWNMDSGGFAELRPIYGDGRQVQVTALPTERRRCEYCDTPQMEDALTCPKCGAPLP